MRRSQGFTIIEILAATVLSAMLMVSVLGLVSLMAQQGKVLQEQGQSKPRWQSRLEERLRWDLANARRYTVKPHALTLEGYLARDVRTSRVVHRPAKVRYQISPQGWLVRSDGVSTQLMGGDMSRFRWIEPGREITDTGRRGNIPAIYCLELFGTESEMPTLTLRGGQ